MQRWPPSPTTGGVFTARRRATRRPGCGSYSYGCSFFFFFFFLFFLLVLGSFFPSLVLLLVVDGATTTTTTATTASNGPPLSSSSSSSAAPWQPPARDEDSAAENDQNYKGIAFRFAPGGRVLAVEEAAHAVAEDASSNTVVAVQCRGGTVVLSTTQPASPYLYATTTSTATLSTTTRSSKEEKESGETPSKSTASLLSLWLDGDNDGDGNGNHVVAEGVPPATAVAPFLRIPSASASSKPPAIAVTVGNPVSSQLLRRRVVSILMGVTAAGAGHSDVAQLARRCADRCQIVTQTSGSGSSSSNGNSDVLLPVALLLADAASVWRVDPTGQFWQFQALAAGRYAARVEELLVEKLQQQAWCVGVEQGGESSSDDNNSSDKKRPPIPPHQLKDWIARRLSTQEALRIATACVLEAYEQDAHKQALIAAGAASAAAATDKPPQTAAASELPLRGVVLLSSSSSSSGRPRVESYSGKELRDMVIAAASEQQE